MGESKNKKLDDLVRKAVKEVGLETPSLNFTETVISRLETSGSTDATLVYKPLISKIGWGVVVIIVAGLSTVAISGKMDTNSAWFNKIFTGVMAENFLDAMPTLTLSDTVSYSLLIFFVGMVIQMILLKHHLNKRFVLH